MDSSQSNWAIDRLGQARILRSTLQPKSGCPVLVHTALVFAKEQNTWLQSLRRKYRNRVYIEPTSLGKVNIGEPS